MANTPSARKRVRRNAARTTVNNARRMRMRTFIKKVEAAILAKDSDGASAALRAAQPEMQRAAAKGLVHKNASARKISRLAAHVKALKG